MRTTCLFLRVNDSYSEGQFDMGYLFANGGSPGRVSQGYFSHTQAQNTNAWSFQFWAKLKQNSPACRSLMPHILDNPWSLPPREN